MGETNSPSVAHVGYDISPLSIFPTFWPRVYLMKVIPETRRGHYIRYLRFLFVSGMRIAEKL